MKRESMSDRLCRKIKPVCDCFSVALSKAREAEIDVPAKRSFRQIYGSGNGSGDLPQAEGHGVREVAARTKVGMGAFLDCLDDARNSAQLSITDFSIRRSYRKLPE